MTTALAPDLVSALARALGPELDRQKAMQYGVSYKHDVPNAAISVGYSHGPGGLLTWPGVDSQVFNAAMGYQSIISRIPSVGSPYTNPTYQVMTGVTDESGDEPTDPCDDAPIAGLMKGCILTAPFGKYRRETPVLEINRLGQRNDRADPMDLRLVGSPVAPTGIFGGPRGGGSTPRDILDNEISRKFWELDVAFHRLLTRQAWTGNPSNNSGDYQEFAGLAQLVNTGYVDALTGNACASVDSYVRNLGHTRIDTAAGAAQLVAGLTDMYYQLKDRAARAGLAPVNILLAMRPQLFYEITAIWPCTYLTFRCMLDGTSANNMNVDSQDAVRFRDEMRAGKYLIIDGDRVEVVVDDGIPELNGNSSGGAFPAGCFESDIYFLPMSVQGGQSTLFLEYFEYQNPSISSALANLGASTFRVDGAWLTYNKVENLCIQWGSKIEPRLILRTPWLAGRLGQIVYCPLQHVTDSFPDDPYHTDGGAQFRSGPSYYALWQD